MKTHNQSPQQKKVVNICIQIACDSRERITLLLCDGKSEEGDEGGDSQNWEDHGNSDEELETFEPGAPVVLYVHDVRDKGPECQNTCQSETKSYCQGTLVKKKYRTNNSDSETLNWGKRKPALQ